MNTLKQYFDDFSIAARIKPAVTACFPFLVIAIYKGFLDDDFSEAGITFALAIVLIGFASYIVREWGKAHEEKMVRELNGLPTTIILRFSDDTIDSISKLRYHQWLSSKIDFKC